MVFGKEKEWSSLTDSMQQWEEREWCVGGEEVENNVSEIKVSSQRNRKERASRSRDRNAQLIAELNESH